MGLHAGVGTVCLTPSTFYLLLADSSFNEEFSSALSCSFLHFGVENAYSFQFPLLPTYQHHFRMWGMPGMQPELGLRKPCVASEKAESFTLGLRDRS